MAQRLVHIHVEEEGNATMRKLLSARLTLQLAISGLFLPFPAQAQEVFVGGYVHGVDTPFTLRTDEGGADIMAGYRFNPVDLGFLGDPQPYAMVSVNTSGDTDFIAGGLGWRLGSGPVYARPGIGLAVQDGPSRRFAADGTRTDLGSPVLFVPEIALGVDVSDRVAIEASWVHISHARLFNWGQNPGLDMMGARLIVKLP